MNETQKQLGEILENAPGIVFNSDRVFIEKLRALLPQTKIVHGVEIDMHLTECEDDQKIYFLNIYTRSAVDSNFFDEDNEVHRRILKMGLIYDTPKKVKAHRDVLFPNGVWDE